MVPDEPRVLKSIEQLFDPYNAHQQFIHFTCIMLQQIFSTVTVNVPIGRKARRMSLGSAVKGLSATCVSDRDSHPG